ncbi:uncharacterized protein LOC110860564 isoform X2 [Folsomia candida]|uniref:uncharacterized protein LOC110860564 isoform X2 n=1 Tax=Folsomia candida TaxID=158441 RepID=UPI001604CB8D|nr:uncharacterized protein LOC110860564 isoform X2 [Folsomia candida]
MVGGGIQQHFQQIQQRALPPCSLHMSPNNTQNGVTQVGGDDEVPGCSKSVTYMNGGGRNGTSAPETSAYFDGMGGDMSIDFNNIDFEGDDDDGGDGGDDSDGDPEDFKWPNNLPHPLLIPDVVRDIMNKLGMADVDRFRQVCRVWNEESCAVLQAKKIVALLEIDSMKYYLEKFSTTTYFPHHHFELHMENLLEPQIMRRFWTIFGSHVKVLDLRQASLFIETLFDIIAQHLPNLERLAIKSLPRKLSLRRNSHPPPPPLNFVMFQLNDQLEHLEENHHQGSSRTHALPAPRDDWTSLRFNQIKELTLCWCQQDEDATINILKDLLRSMPSLERLLVTDIPPLSAGGNIGVIGHRPMVAIPQPAAVGARARLSRLLVQVLTDPNILLPKLSTLNFPIEVGNTELTKLTEKRYRFNTVILKLHTGTKNSFLKEFLISASPSLQYLEIAFPDGFFADGITFPAYSQIKPHDRVHHLQQVVHLALKNFHGPLNLLKNLKLVRKLTINGSKFEPYFGFVHKLVGPMSTMSAVKVDHNLQVLRTDSYINSEDIISLAASFPLLRILKLFEVDDAGLGIIYRNLPYIKELEIIKGKVTDQGLSGVPLEVCKDMAETSTFLFVDPAKFRSDLFLGSLQYLKTLKLVCDDVTDISIVFGIVGCKNLETLTLHSPSISDMGLFKIADMMPQLQFLDIHECENVSEEGKFYVKEKMQHVPTLILEPYSMQKLKLTDNSFRQVGYPYRGRCVRPERYGPDEEYDRLPLRERMLMAMDRRRYIALRMVHRVGRVAAPAAAAAMHVPPPAMGNLPDDDELRMLMELHPMFVEDEAFMNFGEERNVQAIVLSDSDDEDDIPTPPNEIAEDEEYDNIAGNINLNPFLAHGALALGQDDDQDIELDAPEDMQQDFLLDNDHRLQHLFPPPMDPRGNGAN